MNIPALHLMRGNRVSSQNKDALIEKGPCVAETGYRPTLDYTRTYSYALWHISGLIQYLSILVYSIFSSNIS